jgi:hypothetical protein
LAPSSLIHTQKQPRCKTLTSHTATDGGRKALLPFFVEPNCGYFAPREAPSTPAPRHLHPSPAQPEVAWGSAGILPAFQRLGEWHREGATTGSGLSQNHGEALAEPSCLRAFPSSLLKTTTAYTAFPSVKSVDDFCLLRVFRGLPLRWLRLGRAAAWRCSKPWYCAKNGGVGLLAQMAVRPSATVAATFRLRQTSPDRMVAAGAHSAPLQKNNPKGEPVCPPCGRGFPAPRTPTTHPQPPPPPQPRVLVATSFSGASESGRLQRKDAKQSGRRKAAAPSVFPVRLGVVPCLLKTEVALLFCWGAHAPSRAA